MATDWDRAGSASDVVQRYVDLPGDGSYRAKKVVAVSSTGTDIGGGTQYAESATATTATGTLIMWKNGTSLTAASAANPLPVTGGGGGTQYAEGTANTTATTTVVGVKSTAGVSTTTLATGGTVQAAAAGLDRVLYMRPHAGLEDLFSGVASTTSGTATQVVAGVASTKLYVTSVTISNTSGTNTEVDILSSATVRWTFPTGTNGVTHTFNVPLAPNAAGDPLKFQARAATSTVTVSISGFKSKI